MQESGGVNISDYNKELEQMIKREYDSLGKQILTCRQCGATYSKLSNIKDHIRTHLQKKVYRCHRCGKGFAWLGNKNRHVKKLAC